jgi:hypothetical protein
MRYLLIAAALCLLLKLSALIAQSVGSVVVNLSVSDGAPLEHGVVVNLLTLGGVSAGTGQRKGGEVDFEDVPEGRYTVEVIAAGYQKVTQEVEVTSKGERAQVYISVKPESAADAAWELSGAPVLDPDAQKELSKTLKALRGNKLEEARKHLEKLSRTSREPRCELHLGSLLRAKQ